MWLKLLTGLSIVLGMVLLCLWPWLLHQQPHSRASGFPPVARLVFEYKAMVFCYMGTILFSFIAAMSLSGLLLGKAREDYKAALTKNLKELIDTMPGKNQSGDQ